MTPEEHKQRHIKLHESLDELLADFIQQSEGPILDLPILDLINWSFDQTQNPGDIKPTTDSTRRNRSGDHVNSCRTTNSPRE